MSRNTPRLLIASHPGKPTTTPKCFTAGSRFETVRGSSSSDAVLARGLQLHAGMTRPPTLFAHVARGLSHFAELLWPARCAACDAVGRAPFCADCALALLETPSGCPVCGVPQPEEQLPSLIPRRCAACVAQAPPFAQVRAPYLYWGALAEAIAAFKYRGRAELAEGLSALFLAAEAPRVDVIAPVPLHPRRLRERGYDQAHLLAVELGKRLRLPVRPLLRRVRATRPQVGLDREGRAYNVLGAFRASGPVRGLRVCLVDDVFTTGATARAATLALLEAGAREVVVRALARA